MAHIDSIRPYGEMGCWTKGTTKTGEPHVIPVPWQAMRWLEAWLRCAAFTISAGGTPVCSLVQP
jgi:integrase